MTTHALVDADGNPMSDPETREQIEELLDMINHGYADAFAMVGRWAEADDTVTSAVVLAIDPAGADIEVTGDEGTRASRLEFEEVIADLHGLEGAMLGLLEDARAARPMDPLTSIEKALERTERQPTHRCTVQGITELNSNLRALTLGPVPDWENLGGDQAISLFLALPGRPVPETIQFAELREMDDDVRPKSATYSIRRHDQENSTIEVWIVLHGDDPATIGGWAAAASVGDEITVWGPRRASEPMDDLDRLIGVCDEAGAAATLATIDDLPTDVPVDLVIEVADADSEFAATDRPNVTIHWCHRDGIEPGTGSLLLESVRALVPEPVDRVGVFGAGESRRVTEVRKYLRREVAIPASHVALTGYWRRQ